MYNIIQLNDKSLSELQTIASELGITKVESLKKEDLVSMGKATPFEGETLYGECVLTVKNGKIVYKI